MHGPMQAAGFEILYDIPRKRTADHAAAAATHDVEVRFFPSPFQEKVPYNELVRTTISMQIKSGRPLRKP